MTCFFFVQNQNYGLIVTLRDTKLYLLLKSRIVNYT